ncbi:uncharacterized protein AMSG_06867 [Thecamonas trahens ATCC 50062]|uniref:BAR domain-containing protein n=1 Tax=Thecamonas trahens ATCC 50062 TaxID=461836 RepID=A0A0L0DDI3_THETB|nr:hypothetical protein AMSG_06867 [Thecamonas trahens ATCC 50062]KNC50379.1 hypothetical protein AMSG_06867 [Thecamonas trahens ATCC 50062]|eukprot:XP_013756921.1 hypothetical protein AMSG_06867 [Thecamonas trahens ATCC 50062]
MIEKLAVGFFDMAKTLKKSIKALERGKGVGGEELTHSYALSVTAGVVKQMAAWNERFHTRFSVFHDTVSAFSKSASKKSKRLASDNKAKLKELDDLRHRIKTSKKESEARNNAAKEASDDMSSKNYLKFKKKADAALSQYKASVEQFNTAEEEYIGELRPQYITDLEGVEKSRLELVRQLMAIVRSFVKMPSDQWASQISDALSQCDEKTDMDLFVGETREALSASDVSSIVTEQASITTTAEKRVFFQRMFKDVFGAPFIREKIARRQRRADRRAAGRHLTLADLAAAGAAAASFGPSAVATYSSPVKRGESRKEKKSAGKSKKGKAKLSKDPDRKRKRFSTLLRRRKQPPPPPNRESSVDVERLQAQLAAADPDAPPAAGGGEVPESEEYDTSFIPPPPAGGPPSGGPPSGGPPSGGPPSGGPPHEPNNGSSTPPGNGDEYDTSFIPPPPAGGPPPVHNATAHTPQSGTQADKAEPGTQRASHSDGGWSSSGDEV